VGSPDWAVRLNAYTVHNFFITMVPFRIKQSMDECFGSFRKRKKLQFFKNVRKKRIKGRVLAGQYLHLCEYIEPGIERDFVRMKKGGLPAKRSPSLGIDLGTVL